MRIAVMNLQSGVATTRGAWQYATSAWKYALPHSSRPLEAAGELLKRENIDIALCTEVTEGGLRSGFASQLRILQTSSGLPHTHFFRAMKTLFAVEGGAIMSAYPLSETWTHPLPGPKSQRVLGDALVHTPEGDVRIFLAHLSLRQAVRKAQVQHIADLIRDVNEPCIIAGDFNETDVAAFASLLSAGFSEYSLPTYPSWGPKKKLIRIFIRKLSIRELRIPEGVPFSDHVPFIATILRE